MWAGREHSRRLDALEKTAGEARDLGNKALAEISGHTATCTVRQENIDHRLSAIGDALKWANRQGVLVLLAILGAILLGIAEHKGLF